MRKNWGDITQRDSKGTTSGTFKGPPPGDKNRAAHNNDY